MNPNRFKRFAVFGAALLISSAIFAQNPTKDSALLKIYHGSAPKINDLVNTKLDVRFDYAKHYLYGKEWVTLKPHFYATDSLTLDAKGMDINQIAVVKNGKNVPLKFSYDSLKLKINLDKKYTSAENYTVYLSYTAKPDQLKAVGSAAISDAKGLYFINSDGADKTKPIQIWTQGETESSSAWFPTIDKPDQKTLQEISMTVPSKYVTLSNGKLISQKPAGNGLRTDTWKMDKPNAPYLFMMAVGDFKIYKDHYKDKEVNYYLEPKYAPFAKQIFGFTPELIGFYSQKLGVDFPWNKYSQIVVRDYVSGAMENTTATLHGEYVQKTAREMLDDNYSAGESTIAHELFHQWFGDYVTTESWSNLTVNESFADFSETLWAEHRYGKDEGGAHIYENLQAYLNSKDAQTKNLVRFHYVDKEDMFDVVTYQKGGCILNMLRNYLGEDAFFSGLNLYLRQNAFGNGEAQQLRLAFEKVSGKDLNWFFNQWYYGAGNPDLTINYHWDEAGKTQSVYLAQTQEGAAFTLPMAVDIYAGGKMERHQVWMKGKSDTLTFKLPVKPNLVNVDGDKVIIAKKTDNKTTEEFAFQYFNAPLYIDRLEAILALTGKQNDADARKVMLAALKDKYYGLRTLAIRNISLSDAATKQSALPILTNIAQNDHNNTVKATAIVALGRLKNPADLSLFKSALNSQSYAVQGAALTAFAAQNPAGGLQLAKGFEKDNKGALTRAIVSVYAAQGGETELPFVSKAFDEGTPQIKFNTMQQGYINMLGKINDTQKVNARVDAFKDFAIKYKQFGIDQPVVSMLNQLKTQKQTQANQADAALKSQLNAQADYITKAVDQINGSK
ncbi:M1 family aminopeptidase [Mucilaginibacter sp.]|uniref:M1 family aminopeptidase n=1 Tax=Mucilaginibacter sp. TaxID=1882438 RepID=UPI003B005324